MTSKVIVLLEDDLDGTRADETIEFGIDGTSYAGVLGKGAAVGAGVAGTTTGVILTPGLQPPGFGRP
jgi:hypothetical protein